MARAPSSQGRPGRPSFSHSVSRVPSADSLTCVMRGLRLVPPLYCCACTMCASFLPLTGVPVIPPPPTPLIGASVFRPSPTVHCAGTQDKAAWGSPLSTLRPTLSFGWALRRTLALPTALLNVAYGSDCTAVSHTLDIATDEGDTLALCLDTALRCRVPSCSLLLHQPPSPPPPPLPRSPVPQ